MNLRRTAISSWLRLLVLFLGIIIVGAVLGTSYPQFEEPFIAMGILGADGTANNYFPGNSSTISVGTLVNWKLYVYNHMRSTMNISIRVKLLNSTMPGPNDVGRTPSPIEPFLVIPLRLAANETVVFPFFFQITEAVRLGNSIEIIRMEVMDMTYSVDVLALDGRLFRLVFELWSYDKESASYVYSWKSIEEIMPVWNQVWFDVVLNV